MRVLTRKFSNRSPFAGMCALLLCLCGCQAGIGAPARDAASATPWKGLLTPYLTASPMPTFTPAGTSTSTPEPSATTEPQTHEVVKGEDLLTIAIRYGVSLEALKAANPDINPSILSIGTLLVIPGDEEAQATPTPQPAQATPAPISLGGVRCAAALDGGLWCFVLVQNPLQDMVSGVSVRITLQDEKGNTYTSEGAALLNGLRSGYGVPLQVYFPPQGDEMLDPQMKASAELISALPVAVDAGCCLPLRIDNNRYEVLEDGLSAEVNGEVMLEGVEGSTASQGWVLAVAYDVHGRICGLRRWEASEALNAGQPQPYHLRVYSVDESIDHVEVMAEAHY